MGCRDRVFNAAPGCIRSAGRVWVGRMGHKDVKPLGTRYPPWQLVAWSHSSCRSTHCLNRPLLGMMQTVAANENYAADNVDRSGILP